MFLCTQNFKDASGDNEGDLRVMATYDSGRILNSLPRQIKLELDGSPS